MVYSYEGSRKLQ